MLFLILLIFLISCCARPVESLQDKGGRPLVLGGLRFITAVAVSPDGKLLATGSVDRRIRIWDVKSGEMLNIMKGHTDDLTCIDWYPDGRHLVSGSMDSTLRIWDLKKGRSVNILQGHRDEILCVTVGRIIASGSLDGTVRIWDALAGKSISKLPGEGPAVIGIDFTKNDNRKRDYL